MPQLRPYFVVCSILGLIGCGPAVKPEPVTPEPVVIVTPTETDPPAGAGEAPTPAKVDKAGLQGTWTHTMPWNDGKDRTVILKYVRDQDGRERFEFVQQYWSYKPVFVEQIKNGDQTELHFKLVAYDNESDETPHTLRYVLKPDNGTWSGQLFESWTEAPYQVVLTKSE